MLEALSIHNDKWLSYAFYLTKCRDKAHDLVQDMYLKVHDSNKELNPTYIQLIIYSIFIDGKRKEKEEPTSPDNNKFLSLFDTPCDYELEHDLLSMQESTGEWFETATFHDKVIFTESLTIGQRKFSREADIPISLISRKFKKYRKEICQRKRQPQQNSQPKAWETLLQKLHPQSV